MSSDLDPALHMWLKDIAAEYGSRDRVVLIARETGAVVALIGSVVVKVHPAGTDVDALARRLALAADPALRHVLAAPLEARLLSAPADSDAAGRPASVWPRLQVLRPDVVDPPWAGAARLLADLHRAPVPAATAGLVHGGPERLHRVLVRLREGPDAGTSAGAAVLAAGAAVADELDSAAPERGSLVHGDWHLGQVGRADDHADPSEGWRLLDLDELGVGDPAWDLGRAAGFFAAGLLPEEVWSGFLAAYRDAGGPGVPATGDPWPRIDRAARAEIVVAAARALRRAPRDGWDDGAEALVITCSRMRQGCG